ncbi:MAG: hypothetical protein J0M24_16845 [Verrucomicrobia bacterium]|nr:hypothetical protein [Verrucomicrobiota bacterium]
MNRRASSLVWVLWVWAILGTGLVRGADSGSPDVNQLIERMVARAQEGLSDTNGLQHTWRRVTVIEDLDSRGKVEKRRTKEHVVVGRGSVQEATLVKVNDQALPERELDRERKREGENQSKYAQRGGRRGQLELDEKMIRRFQYQWLSNDWVDGRWTHVLAFTPLPEADSGKIADRVIGNLGGRIWVDAEVYEVARIDAQLTKKISVGGFLAELNRLGFLIERRPLPGGAWVNTRLDSFAAGRKLFDRFSGRMEVVQEGFAVMSEAASGATTTVSTVGER